MHQPTPYVQPEQPATPDPEAREQRRTAWVSRITGAVALAFLIFALLEWALRPYHYRLVLVLLVVAMFAAVLHSYTFESGGK